MGDEPREDPNPPSSSESRDVFGSSVLAVFLAIVMFWVGIKGASNGHPLDFLLFSGLTIFAIPRVRGWFWKRWDYKSSRVVWALRVLYLLFGSIAVFIAIGSGGMSGVGVVMVLLMLLVAVGLVFGIRVWRAARSAAESG